MPTIAHLSASQLCLFRSSPAMWVVQYLKGHKTDAGPAAWRGSAVEVGLDKVLHRADTRDALVHAFKNFEEQAQGDLASSVEKQRCLLTPMLSQAILAAGDLDYPLSYQKKVELQVGAPWPVMGYLDWRFPDFVMDLKTTERLPSEPKLDHVMQVSIYAEAEGVPGRLLYVTDKRSAWYDVTPAMQADGIAEAKRLALKIQNMLAFSDDPDKLLSFLPLDPENFRCKDYIRYLAQEAA